LLEDPEHPFVAIVGGAKVSGKLKVLDNLVRKVDRLILGGGMANTFLLAQGRSVGKSLAEHDMVDQARRVLVEAESRGVRVLLPVDVIVAKEVTRGTEYKTLPAEKIPASWHIVDVGKQTLVLIEEALADARTVMWNGPIGVFEIPVFGTGTRHVARILAEKAEAGATVVVGGGDSVAAVQQQGLASKMTHISTGGGASLEFLEGRELPGIAVLLDRPKEIPAEKPAATVATVPKAAKIAKASHAAASKASKPPTAAKAPIAKKVSTAKAPVKASAKAALKTAKPTPKTAKPTPKTAKPKPKAAKPSAKTTRKPTPKPPAKAARPAKPAARPAKPARAAKPSTARTAKPVAKRAAAPKTAKTTKAATKTTAKTAKATPKTTKRTAATKGRPSTSVSKRPAATRATKRPAAKKTAKRSTSGLKRAAATNRARRAR
jgi:hypothetical protein